MYYNTLVFVPSKGRHPDCPLKLVEEREASMVSQCRVIRALSVAIDGLMR